MTTIEQRVSRLEDQMVTKADLEKELTTFARSLIAEIRRELKAEIQALRTELKAEIQALRTELKADNRTQADRVIQAIGEGTNPNF